MFNENRNIAKEKWLCLWINYFIIWSWSATGWRSKVIMTLLSSWIQYSKFVILLLSLLLLPLIHSSSRITRNGYNVRYIATAMFFNRNMHGSNFINLVTEQKQRYTYGDGATWSETLTFILSLTHAGLCCPVRTRVSGGVDPRTALYRSSSVLLL